MKFCEKVCFREMQKFVKSCEIFKKSEKSGSRKVATAKNFTQNEGRPRNLGLKVTGFLGSKVKKSDFFLNSEVNQPLIRRVSGTFFDEISQIFTNFTNFTFSHFLANFHTFHEFHEFHEFHTFQERGLFLRFLKTRSTGTFWTPNGIGFFKIGTRVLKKSTTLSETFTTFSRARLFFFTTGVDFLIFPETFSQLFTTTVKNFHNHGKKFSDFTKKFSELSRNVFKTLRKIILTHFPEKIFTTSCRARQKFFEITIH